MKVMDKNEPNLIKEIEKPALPIFVSNWVFGIGIIEIPMGTPHRIFSFIYTSAILIIYCSLAAYSYPFVLTMTGELETNQNMTYILFFSNVFLTIGTTILGWYRSQGMHKLLLHIATANHLSEKIGIAKNYAQLFLSQLKQISGLLVFVLIVVIINATNMLATDYSRSGKIIAVFVMNYPIIIMFIADSTFTDAITYCRSRFVELNSLLKSLSTTTYDYPQHRRIVKEYSKVYKTSLSSRNDLITVDRTFIIRTAKRAHLEYVKALRKTDDIFSLHVILSVVVSIGVITGTLYNIYGLVLYVKLPRYQFCRVLTRACNWLLYYSTKILMYSYSCHAVSRESIRTGDIISELYDEPLISKETQDEIRDFHIQLIQNSLTFGNYGMIRIDLTLIQTIAGSVTTYLMILIQLGNTT